MAEADDHEVKSLCDWTDDDRLQLVKILVAMANTRGGTVVLERLNVTPSKLDSSRLDDLVNKYVEPRVGGIESEPRAGGMVIRVRESEQKPHIFVQDGCYRDEAKDRDIFAFHRGQVWVRHSSKNEPATGDDIQRMLREVFARFLTGLSVKVQEGGLPLALELSGPERHSLPVHISGKVVEGGLPVGPTSRGAALPIEVTEKGGLRVRLSGEEDATPVVLELERAYPYTTSALAASLRRPPSWVRKASTVLGFPESRAFSLAVRNSKGGVMLWRYSEEALRALNERLAAEPAWDPFKTPARGESEASGSR